MNKEISNPQELDSFGLYGKGSNLQVKHHNAAVNGYINFALVCIVIAGLLAYATNNIYIFWIPFILFASVLSYCLIFKSELYYSEKIAQYIIKYIYGQKGKKPLNIENAIMATYELKEPQTNKQQSKQKTLAKKITGK